MTSLFEQARFVGYNAFCKTNDIARVTEKDKRILGINLFPEVWRINVFIFPDDSGIAKSTELLVGLPEEFPLVLPYIYLSPKERFWVGNIPHLGANNFICLFDETSIFINQENPYEVIKQCLNKAIEILETGLKEKNKDDLPDEFIAYWKESYGDKDEVGKALNMMEGDLPKPQSNIECIQLSKPYGGYEIIIHDSSDSFLQLKSILENSGIRVNAFSTLYVGKFEVLLPPFNLSNGDTWSIIKEKFPEALPKYEKFINLNSYPKIVIFSTEIKNENILFGWNIASLNTQRNGFRDQSIKQIQVLTKFKKNESVTRISFDKFTSLRMHNRTSGLLQKQEVLKIAVAGMGSIGSNLLPYLLSLDVKVLECIDPERLEIENINRHLLGMSDVGSYKSEGIKRFLQINNPLLDVRAHNSSVVGIINNHPDVLNQCDFVFAAIGKTNIEGYMSSALQTGKIQKPIFFIWVEPYLCGGHCIYLNPGHGTNYLDLFINGIYKYNVIDVTEYSDSSRQFLFKEAGCQVYIPTDADHLFR
jgi:molybdopterin/thiamine biosynthesis adenylyltransferase